MNATKIRTYSTAFLHYGGLLLLGCAVLFVLILNVPQVIGAEHSYVVLSDSMDPTYSAGDVIVVQSVSPEKIQEGDVITFEQPANRVSQTTHRVIDIVHRDQGLYFRTKGDANEGPDPHLVPASNVIGEVWFSIPYVGYVLFFAQTQNGIALLVIVPALLLILTEMWALFRSAQNTSNAGLSGDPMDTDEEVGLDSKGDR